MAGITLPPVQQLKGESMYDASGQLKIKGLGGFGANSKLLKVYIP